MTRRKVLKKELNSLKRLRSEMPRLIDCSVVYGDGYYNQAMLNRVEEDILNIEKEIAAIDNIDKTIKP